MSCEVCADTFTKQIRKKVSCPYCEFTCCSACAQRYILETPDTANCMNCRRAWTRKMLCDMFTKVFVNRDYRSARSNVLFDLERAMFPDTMPYVERELLKKKNAAQIHTNNRQINALGEHRYVFNLIGTSPELMRDQLPALLDIHRLELENQILTREMEVPVKRDQAREFLQPCSRNGCNGFLSTAWKCRACDGYTCKECHEPKNDPHTCNQWRRSRRIPSNVPNVPVSYLKQKAVIRCIAQTVTPRLAGKPERLSWDVSITHTITSISANGAD